MAQPLICHLLIGLPASGKSTFAQKLAQEINDVVVVSTDTIRANLYGDETTQGNWVEIEREVCRQIREAIDKKQPVIYDATNAARPWRMGFLQKQIDLENVEWVGWYLETPVHTCKERNQKRDRQVPDEVIDKMNADLQQSPPDKVEGMLAVYPVPLTEDGFDVEAIRQKIKGLNRVFTNRVNLNKNKTFHQYSRLLDFERLLHLISVIINNPGIGNLAATEPETLKEILDLENLHEFSNSIEEIRAVIAKKYHSIYADAESIKKDLEWLEKNGIIGGGEVTADLVGMDSFQDAYLGSHRYDEIEQFERLIKTIRFLIYYPFLCEENGKPSTVIKELINSKERTFRQTTIIQKMYEYGLFSEPIDINDKFQRSHLENNFREDLCHCLKPYKLLPEFDMKKGYFAGTGIFSKYELNKLYQAIQSQLEEKYFQDPLAADIYDTFERRLIDGRLLEGEKPYPVRLIGTKSIINIEKYQRKFELLEEAIKNGELLEVSTITGSATWSDNQTLTFTAYPLQIVFHNIAWYLAYEIKGGDKNGLLAFVRIDRITFKNTQSRRDINEQKKSLANLDNLYTASAGIYLGDNVDDVKKQHKFLNSQERKQVEIKIVLHATEKAFKFICEGNQRFHKIQMSVPDWFQGRSSDSKIFNPKLKQNISLHQYTIEIILPEWSLEDIDLIRWISSWGKEVKVLQPQPLIDKIQAIGQGIQDIYQDIDLVFCELENVNNLVRIGQEKRTRFIAINSPKLHAEPELVKNKINLNSQNLHSLKIDNSTPLNSEDVEEAVKFIKRIKAKSKTKVSQQFLIYSHSGINLASEVAIALYTALTQDPELAALRISLSYL